jgi:RNA polymerase sigma factor (sigma-70 family)
VAVFDDRASGSYQLDDVVRGPDTAAAAAHEAAIERDYEALRRPLRAMVQTDFPWFRDFDALYQEAWTELLELEARGEVVQNRKALLKKIAWRRALDCSRHRRLVSVDPNGPLMTETPDDAPTPDEAAQIRLTAEALRLVIDELDERQAAVLKLRFDAGLSAREVQERLGLTPKRLEKIMTKAYKQIATQLYANGHESLWTRRQRSLLLACELGIASAAQRQRAQTMIDRDASCRAMLREMRASLHHVAVALPMPAIPLEHRRVAGLDGALSRVDELWLSLRQLPRSVVERFPFGPSTAEQVAAGGTTIGAGATAKFIAFCIAAGGTATVCVNGAHLFEQQHRHKPQAEVQARAKPRVVEPDRAKAAFVRSATTKTPPRTTSKTAKGTAPKTRETPVSSPKSTPPPSPAPQGSVEFGPGNVGSGSASRQPAVAPANGGGEFTP